MKNIYKYILAFIFIFVMGLFAFFDNKYTAKSPEIISSSAKTDSFESLNDLENNSTVIVTGIKKDEENPSIGKSHGVVGFSYVVSNFEVTNVIKNTTEDIIKIDDIIQLMEYQVYDSEANKIYTLNNYRNMLENNNYILFLKKSETNDWYIIKGITFGKVPLDNVNEETLMRSNNSNISSVVNKIHDNAKEKYKSYIVDKN